MIYLFHNKETDEYREIEMRMKDYAPYLGENQDEDCWERVYEIPQISMGHSTSKTVDALMQLDMPAGVDIEIKT